MVETVLDPIRMPTVTLSQKEMDDIEALMAQGQLPPDYLDRYHEAVAKNVFGFDHKVDADGNPIEQGRGSPGNQCQQSIDAYKKFGRPEKGSSEAEFKEFNDNLKRMEAELRACNAARKALADARGKRTIAARPR